ncbi:MAG: HEAT repeat domain-containing protein [Crocosphaera sp.]|nr:HEAT repeat domain-containing protein [Crocosphaera sp.]
MSQGHLPATQHISSESPLTLSIDWKEVSRRMLKYSLPINPMSTQPNHREEEAKKLHISLECLQLANHSSVSLKTSDLNRQGLPMSQYNSLSGEEYLQESWFETISQVNDPNNTRKIAIVGDSGTGKSLCLQKIAHWILENTKQIPIWVSPSQIKTLTVEEYLHKKWLNQAAKGYRSQKEIPLEQWQASFKALLENGQVWLLADGIDYWLVESIPRKYVSPLNLLIQQQEIGNAHIILTCQTLTWKKQPQDLSQFDIYQTRPLAKETGVEKFIQQWFSLHYPWSQKLPTEEDFNKKLCRLLQQPEKQNLQSWLTNPLRLSLVCRLWQKKTQTLPDTVANLYSVLVDEFYQWQAETISTNPKQQEELNQFLSQLALSHRQIGERESAISQSLIEDQDSLLSLALQLNWLKRVGLSTQEDQDNYYQFSDPTFEDYFAALAIDEWQYFLREEGNLGMFQHQWQQILLFWLGREDVTSEDKEALMRALVTFEDGCSPENFYGFKAHLTAVKGLCSFPNSSLAKTIIEKLWGWVLDNGNGVKLRTIAARKALNDLYRPLAVNHLINLLKNYQGTPEQQQALSYLERLAKGNQIATVALTQYLERVEKQSLRWQLAQTLGIIDLGNAKAISTIVEGLEAATTDQEYQKAFLGLEKIAPGQGRGIKALIRLLHRQLEPSLLRRTFECLEIVGKENATAIAILVQLIRTTKEEGIRRQAAQSLEKIDPGNPTAIAGLIKLMQTATSKSIRQEVVYSLGEVFPGNIEAIKALVHLLKENDDIYMRWIAISSLGKIGTNNEEAIAILQQLLNPEEPLLIRKEALDSLGKIAPDNPALIKISRELMEEFKNDEAYREIAETLGKIDPGNTTSINALTQVLKTSNDKFVLRQVAVSLGKIDPGNLDALTVLINLIQDDSSPDICRLAAESLGEIGMDNPAAIAALIRFLETNSNSENRRCAAKSLSKIAVGNKEAVAIFIKLLPIEKSDKLGQQIADSLIETLPIQQMKQVVTQLRDRLDERSLTDISPSYRVLWHCVQHLSYENFKEAWYQRDLSNNSSSFPEQTKSKTNEIVSKFYQFKEQIKQSSQLESKEIIFIDSSRFIDTETPAIDIYDQILEQDYLAFEHGLPETLAKLRLYWHLLQRNYSEKTLILLFYDSASDTGKSNLSPHLLRSLTKFKGVIGVITTQEASGLSVFSPDDPHLAETVLQWLTQY